MSDVDDGVVDEPDSTAVRTALWRALHLLADAPPHVFEDEIGLAMVDPGEGWRDRGDMDPAATSRFRAGIVARARFVEELVEARAADGLGQYVILGAGLDTFAERRPEVASRLQVFEVDQRGTQAWKRQRLAALGYEKPEWLHFVPVDFEAGQSWIEQIIAAGFDAAAPAVVASTGVSLYLTREAIMGTLREAATLAPGATFVMTFYLPVELLDEEDRPGLEMVMQRAAASGTPFLSLVAPDEMLGMASAAGFREVQHVSATELNGRYFAGRPDGLRSSTGEDFLIAST